MYRNPVALVNMLLAGCGVFVHDVPWDLSVDVAVEGQSVNADLVVGNKIY